MIINTKYNIGDIVEAKTPNPYSLCGCKTLRRFLIDRIVVDVDGLHYCAGGDDTQENEIVRQCKPV